MEKIILLHGALGSAETMKPIADILKKRGFDPVIIELPGHGDTPLGDIDFSVKGFTRWLENLIQQKGFQDSHCFGFSMGGYVLLNLAAERHWFNKIITLGTKFRWSLEVADKELKFLDPNKVAEKVPEFASVLKKRHADWKLNMIYTGNLMMKLAVKPLLTTSTYSEIKNDVLILKGDGDNMVSEDESKEAAKHLKKGIFKEVKDTPHPIEKVSPELLAHEIINFITP